ncbi:MAG TPA: peptidyl-prolyl cis-trans isomerase [Opitutaceae bacterium]|jgi:peptidyl-prolyl cis-trans isomerase D
MISWIQRSFQKHFRVVFGVLLTVVIISFIFTIGSTPGLGPAQHAAVVENYYGHNLQSKEETEAMFADARLSAYLQYGSSLDVDRIQNYMLIRAAALHLADEVHLPEPTTEQITDYIKRLPVFAGPNGQFDVSRYDSFRSVYRTNGGAEAEIARVIADDVRATKVQFLVGGPGYILPSDVKITLTKADTEWTVDTAAVDYASYDPGITVTDGEIAKFFSDNSFRYTIPPKVAVDSVEFPAANYMPKQLPTATEVREYYDAHQAQFRRTPEPGKAPPKPDPTADFAAAEPKVRIALQLEKAKRAALGAASDFAYSLYENKVTRGPSLDAYLAAHKVSPVSLKPFDQESGPAELGGSPQVAAAAFGLNADRFYSEAVPSPNGAVVLLWKESIPAHPPLIAEVRDKVRADALDEMKRKRFNQLGATLKAAIEKRLAAGETFEKAATEAGGAIKLAVKSYPSFTFMKRPQDIDPAVLDSLNRLSKGQVSDMQETADKGYLVYVADKKVPVMNDSDPRYVQVRAQLAAAFAQNDSNLVLTEMKDAEIKRNQIAQKKAAP